MNTLNIPVKKIETHWILMYNTQMFLFSNKIKSNTLCRWCTESKGNQLRLERVRKRQRMTDRERERQGPKERPKPTDSDFLSERDSEIQIEKRREISLSNIH